MKNFKLAMTPLAVAFAIGGVAYAAQSPQIPLAGSAIPQFVQPMPTLITQPGGTIDTLVGNSVATPVVPTAWTMNMCEFDAKVLPPGTPLNVGATGTTRTWGYVQGAGCPAAGAVRDTYIGPVLVNTRGVPTHMTWVNNLGDSTTTGVLAYKYSTDQTLHWADPANLGRNDCSMMGGIPMFGSPCAENYAGPIPTVPHLHGGEVPPEIDGAPEGWFTSAGNAFGPAYYSAAGAAGNSAIYKYPNSQEAGPYWFHDHTLGATRLNVYAGMAGGYFIQDPAQNLPANLQSLAEVVPVVIQDRMFDTNGQLYFPGDSSGGVLSSPNPEHPYWVPEFVGDTIVVNGKAWPFFNVQAKRYRFLFLNGSNARTYELSLINQATGATGPAMYVIGTDGGYLDAPIKIDPALGQVLTMMPGERYEVIIDFGAAPNTNFIVRNTGRTPFPKGAPAQGSTLGRVMQFRVGAAPAVADASFNPAVVGATVRGATQKIVRLANAGAPVVAAAKTRQMTLNEVMGMAQTVIDPVTNVLQAYPGGPLEILVNNSKWTGKSNRPNNDFVMLSEGNSTTTLGYTELPKEGDTEIWEIVNITADAHPIHLHLVQFQLINRQGFNTAKYNTAYAAAFPGGLFIPAYGPPYDYRAANNPASGGKDGGNPDVLPFLQGPVKLPLAQENGWKDTVIMYPGEVTRIAVRYAPTDLATNAPAASLAYPFDPSGGGRYGYVWHCHIIDHEDNEMMRPKMVQANPAAVRTYIKGVDY